MTVLDALSQVNGVPQQAEKKRIWVARSAPSGSCQEMILPVDYRRITQVGDTATNYQILPGDRLFVQANSFIKADAMIAVVLAPLERIYGHALLTTSVIGSIQGLIQGQGGQGFNNFNPFFR
jgi:polysaccharide export outer membrane protein